MSKLLVDLNLPYCSSLVVSDKDLVQLLNIMERSMRVRRTYDNGLLVQEDTNEIQISTISDERLILSKTQYELRQAEKAANESAAAAATE